MAKTHEIESKAKTLAEAVGHLADRMNSNLANLADLQHRLLVLTAPDEDMTVTSFDPASGSEDEKVRDAVDIHRASADLMDQAASLMAAMAEGAGAEELDHCHSMFEAAADRLKSLQPSDASHVESAEKEADTDTERAHVADPKTAKAAKLEGVGEKAFGALGMVAKVAGRSPVGKISGLIYIVGEHVEKAVALKKGQEALADLAPDLAPDFKKLLSVLQEGGPHFSDAAEDIVNRALQWSDDHRPDPGDPARLSYDTRLSGMITDARTIRSNITRNHKGLEQVGPALDELLGLLKGDEDTDGASHKLRRAVGADLHPVSRIRKAL